LREIKGLIFDFDGTLADTMFYHWKAWDIIAKRYGIELSRQRLYSMGGIPSRDILLLLQEEQSLPKLDIDGIAREKEQEYLRMMGRVQLIDTIASIARENLGKLPMAIATGGRRSIMERILPQLGIAEWFGAVVTSEDVVRQKPAPDIFLEAARRIGVEPQYCRAYEDTELGLAGIRAAGMEAVDVRKVIPEESLVSSL
jgi:HAD superfamily hydrolase (TIGR01509 family)